MNEFAALLAAEKAWEEELIRVHGRRAYPASRYDRSKHASTSKLRELHAEMARLTVAWMPHAKELLVSKG